MKPLRGIVFKILSAFLFSVMLVVVKLIPEEIPSGQIVFARALFGILPLLFLLSPTLTLRQAIHTNQPMSHVARAMVGCTGMFLWFAALDNLPLPDATAISYAAPLITLVLAAALLGEVVRVHRWTAVLVGFSGVLLILSPHLGSTIRGTSDAQATAAMFALGAAFFMGLAQVFVRRMTQTETTTSIVFYFSVSTAGVALVSAPFGWLIPDLLTLAMLVSIGLLGGVAQILLTMSFRNAEASIVAPFEYTTMLWALTFGFFIFDERPGVMVLLGASIVIASGIFVILRERQLGIERERSKAARAMG